MMTTLLFEPPRSRAEHVLRVLRSRGICAAMSHALLLTAVGAGLPAGDPVCGNSAGLRYYSQAAEVKSGPCVDLLTREARAGEPVSLRFYVSEKRSGQPLEKLELQHEKLMHVIGVREDLKEFFHVHPVKTGPGLWVVANTFPSAGKYKIWTDIAFNGATFTLAQPLLTVSGEQAIPAATTQVSVSRRVKIAGFEVSVAHGEPIIAGAPNEFIFTIRNSQGDLVGTDDFLGGPMHIVAIHEKFSEYRHGHPERSSSPVNGIRFRQVLEEPGRYKLFAQFRPSGTTLSPDEALLAEFYINVISAKAASSLTRQ